MSPPPRTPHTNIDVWRDDTGRLPVSFYDQFGNSLPPSAGGTSQVDNAAFTPSGSSVNPSGYLVDDVATSLVSEGFVGVPRMTPARVTLAVLTDETGALLSRPFPFADTPVTAGGASAYSFLSTAAVQAVQIKGSAGQVYALHFFNNSATIVYLRLYNQTGAPASGDTANIVYRALIPANTSGAGFVVPIPTGTPFGTGIGLRVTASIADNDNTALSANTVLGNVFYK